MPNKKEKYTVTLTEEQMRVVQNALEDYFRLRMGQDYSLSEDLASMTEDLSPSNPDHEKIFDRYVNRRNCMNEILRAYFRIAFGPMGCPDEKTDDMMTAECIWDAIRFERGLSRWGSVLPVGPEPVPEIKKVETDTAPEEKPVSDKAAHGAPDAVRDFASRLNGIEYLEEREEMWEEAKQKGYVVVFGYSDDNMELRGAVEDEIGCWNGRTIYLTKEGEVSKKDTKNRLDAAWYGKVNNVQVVKPADLLTEDFDAIPWTYVANFPHEEFMMHEEGDPYCRGIVFSLEVLRD